MACINPDGTLSPSAKTVVSTLQKPSTLQELAQATNLPLYRLRSSLRELVDANLVAEENGVYKLTEAGKTHL